MARSHLIRSWVIAAAVASAIPSGLTAAPIGESEAGMTKEAACALVSCAKGTLKCGDIHMVLSDPLVGKFSVTWYCYEKGPEF